jgi:hypothetical protein
MGADGTHWFFRPSAADADAPVSFTAYKGSIVAAERASYLRFSDFTLTYNRQDTTLTGAAMGRAIEAGLSMPGNEVQQIAVSATGGTFTISYAGQTTSAIAYNATAAVVLAALEALSNIPAGAMRVSQTVSASPLFTYLIEFGGSLGETNVAAVTTGVGSLTGGASTATVTTVTAGAAVTSVTLVPLPDAGLHLRLQQRTDQHQHHDQRDSHLPAYGCDGSDTLHQRALQALLHLGLLAEQLFRID